MARALFFHEEDYCRLEVLPRGNRKHCEAQFRRLGTPAAGGVGLEEVRGDLPVPLARLGITLDQLDAALGPLLGRCDEVYTGYGAIRTPCANTLGYGSDELALFADLAEGRVAHIWACLDFTQEDTERLSRPFLALAERWDLILVDWGEGQVVDLRNGRRLAAYLEERREEILALLEELGGGGA